MKIPCTPVLDIYRCFGEERQSFFRNTQVSIYSSRSTSFDPIYLPFHFVVADLCILLARWFRIVYRVSYILGLLVHLS